MTSAITRGGDWFNQSLTLDENIFVQGLTQHRTETKVEPFLVFGRSERQIQQMKRVDPRGAASTKKQNQTNVSIILFKTYEIHLKKNKIWRTYS